MDPFARVALVTLIMGAVVSGCTCNEPTSRPEPVSSSATAPISAPPLVSSAPPRTPRPTSPAPKAETFTLTTSDGVRIEASSWSGGDRTSPVVILVHRLGGAREEWTPLVERIFPPKHPMNVVALDLRGHGQSKSAAGHPKAKKGKLLWQSFDQAAFERMDEDLAALRTHLDKGGPPRMWLLVGSDLGASLVVRHVAKQPAGVAAVGLVSPGASLRGLDIYPPFGAVLDRPNLLIAGVQDTVSYQPAKSMAAMAKQSKLVTFPARGHGAQFLGEQHWEMWDELADWIEARVKAESMAVDPVGSSSAAPATSAPPSGSSGR